MARIAAPLTAAQAACIEPHGLRADDPPAIQRAWPAVYATHDLTTLERG